MTNVAITGLVGDSAAIPANGRIEFAQAVRFNDGVLQVTQALTVAQVIAGELRTLAGDEFYLPSNPEGTAVRVREVLGGRTFEWWTAVPDAASVEYRELEPVESSSVPASVWGAPPWLTQVTQMRDETIQAIDDGLEAVDALGGVAGLQQLAVEAGNSAAESSASAALAATEADRSGTEANRAEAAADSIDTEVIGSRLDAVESELPRAVSASAYIRHVELPDGVNYEVIRIRGGRAAIQKIQPKAVTASGTLPTAGLLTPKQMIAESGEMSIVNADAWSGATTKRIAGLHIIDGVAVQNFGVQAGDLVGANVEALVQKKDGQLVPVYAADGKTAQQYVNEGAWASFGYGPIVALGGAVRNFAALPAFSGFAAPVSARVILGQAANGDYIIILVDGKSGGYGIAGDRIGQIAVAEGCHIAINMDGGGTTQAVWGGETVHPSTDTSGERSAMSYLAIRAPLGNGYDSGEIVLTPATGVTAVGSAPAISVRQTGADVTLQLRASGTFPTKAWVPITASGVPVRYRAADDYLMKGVAFGVTGIPLGISAATGSFVLNARCNIAAETSNVVLGQVRWRARNA